MSDQKQPIHASLPIKVFFGVYAGVLLLIAVYSLAIRDFSPEAIGNSLIYVGGGIALTALITLNQYGGKGSGMAASQRIRDDAQLKKWRQAEKPVEKVTWAVIAAAVTLAATGLLLANLHQ